MYCSFCSTFCAESSSEIIENRFREVIDMIEYGVLVFDSQYTYDKIVIEKKKKRKYGNNFFYININLKRWFGNGIHRRGSNDIIFPI